MHRSGTSALSRIVNLLGASGPQPSCRQDLNNPRGFWESLENLSAAPSAVKISRDVLAGLALHRCGLVDHWSAGKLEKN